MNLKLTKEEADFLSILFKSYVINDSMPVNTRRKEIRLYKQVGEKINKATSKSYGYTRVF